MDVNTLTFAFVIVALGIGGVILYLKGREFHSCDPFIANNLFSDQWHQTSDGLRTSGSHSPDRPPQP